MEENLIEALYHTASLPPRKPAGESAGVQREKPRLHLETHPDLKRAYILPADVQRIEKISYDGACRRIMKLRRVLGKPYPTRVLVAEYCAHYGYRLVDVLRDIPEYPTGA